MPATTIKWVWADYPTVTLKEEKVNEPKIPTLIQAREMENREFVYKVCRRCEPADHAWYSALAGKFGGIDTKWATTLKYACGRVTKDDPDGEGIFIYLDKAYAIDQANRMATKTEGQPLAVFSAEPLGDIVIPAGESKTATCDGVMLIEKIADIAGNSALSGRFTSMGHIWEDITGEVKAVLHVSPGKEAYVWLVDANGNTITGFPVPKMPSVWAKDYRIESHARDGRIGDQFKVFKKTG